MDSSKFWEHLDEKRLTEFVTSGIGTGALLLGILATVLVYGQIAKRAGFSRWWSLLLLIPGVSALVPIVFAMVPWPVENGTKRSRTKRRRRDD